MQKTELITLALFGRRNLALDGTGVELVRSLIGRLPLSVDSYSLGPDFKRKSFAKTQVENLDLGLALDFDSYALHLWDESAQIAGGPVFMVRLAGRSDSFHQLMVDIPASLFLSPAIAAEIVRLATVWIPDLDLISGYMHDADDFYFQNESNPEVFRLSGRSLRGYRLKSIFRTLKREIDVERNPGHSHFREGRMFTVAWLNFFGRDMVDLYGRQAILSAEWDEVAKVGECCVGRLYSDPFNPEEQWKRKLQARVRSQLRVDEIAHTLLPKGGGLVERIGVDFRR